MNACQAWPRVFHPHGVRIACGVQATRGRSAPWRAGVGIISLIRDEAIYVAEASRLQVAVVYRQGFPWWNPCQFSGLGCRQTGGRRPYAALGRSIRGCPHPSPLPQAGEGDKAAGFGVERSFCGRDCRALLFPGPSRPRRAGGGKARRGARMDARAFDVSTWTCCRRTPQPARVVTRAGMPA